MVAQIPEKTPIILALEKKQFSAKADHKNGRYFILNNNEQNEKFKLKNIIKDVYTLAKSSSKEKAEDVTNIKNLYTYALELDQEAEMARNKANPLVKAIIKIRQFFGNLFSSRNNEKKFLESFTGISHIEKCVTITQGTINHFDKTTPPTK